MLKYFFVAFLFAVIAVVALAGFRGSKMAHPPIEIFPDMDHQPKYQPQHESEFWADGRAARPPVDGTVPLGYVLEGKYLQADGSNNRVPTSQGGNFTDSPNYYNTGKMEDVFGDGFPVEVSPEFVARGRERYNINCAICHGAAGNGQGIVGQYGLVGIADLTAERIRTMPDGEIFNTITHGKNTMGPYGGQVTVEDRWAIISYVRALQISAGIEADKLPEQIRAELGTPKEAAK